MNKALAKRLVRYIIGLFILTVGIALSVKSDQGVSPVSAPPYSAALCTELSIGTATIIFHIILVIFQIILLRKNFKLRSLLQIPAGILFGYFTDLCCSIAGFIPAADNFVFRTLLTMISVVVTAAGVYIYLSADIMPLAVEGFIKVLSETTGKSFFAMKTVTDISMAIISAAACLIVTHSLGSIGIGTVIAALFTGLFIDLTKKAEISLTKKKEKKTS